MNRQIQSIKNIAVLGSGTMGSQIASHCVNAGLNVWLMDMKSDDASDPDRIARQNLQKSADSKPSPLAMPDYAERIRLGNFEDDFEKLSRMDWICEAIVEKPEIKSAFLRRIEKMWKPGTVVSTNTSGLSVNDISSECSLEFRRNFLGTHFFNPPRYMKLVEIIPTEATDRNIVKVMSQFCESVLGKGIVECNDTPNFIANRIGIFSMASIMPWFFNGSFRIEEIDLLTGEIAGYSKAATFRTADMVGIDVLKQVAENLVPSIPGDERRELFNLPEELDQMVQKGLLGRKSGQGFYKKVSSGGKKEYHVLDPVEMSFEPPRKTDFEAGSRAWKKFDTPAERLKYMVDRNDKAGRLLWKLQCDLLLYSVNRLPEVTDSPEAVDRAMKWGFNWSLGPFERWDALGVEETVRRMEKDGHKIPQSIRDMLESGRKTFYEDSTVYSPAGGKIQSRTAPAKGAITVSILDRQKKEVWGSRYAGMYDMGDGIALMEFRSYKQTISSSVIEALETVTEKVREGFTALVIGHDHENFSYGANLSEILSDLSKGRVDKIKNDVSQFQKTVVGLRYQPFPVVCAAAGRIFGGGAELMMHCDKVVAHHELYCGLVEFGAGLIPAGGGTKELLSRVMKQCGGEERADPMPYIRNAFKTIGQMKVSESAPQALQLGYLNSSDVIIMNRDRLLGTAKQQARALADAVYQPSQASEIQVMGRAGYGILKLMLYLMSESKFITSYETLIGEKLAWVMSGGDLSEPQYVPESYLLKLERDMIGELLEDTRTQKRMEHLLKTGKPLRN